MKKLGKHIIIGMGTCILVLIFVGLFFVDIGINSKSFIKRDFNQAFEYRTSGDCVSFSNYFNRDNDKWKDTCEKEKKHDDATPIRSFKIQSISHKLGSNRAFLQVELTRLNSKDGKDYSYSVNYEMKKAGLQWKIDQENNQ